MINTRGNKADWSFDLMPIPVIHGSNILQVYFRWIILQFLLQLPMFSQSHYSPFNRSYQFIHLQNSAYHFKNKQNVRPIVKTNLKRSSHSMSHSQSKSKASPNSHRYSFSEANSTRNLRLHLGHDVSADYEEPHRVIHRDEITQRAKSARITRQNRKIVKRLIDTDCMVTDKSRAEVFYNKQQKYRNLRRRYQQNGQRHVIPLGNLKYLNPTLASFKTSHHNQSKGLKTGQNEKLKSESEYMFD